MYLMFPLEMMGKQCKSSFLSLGLFLKAPNQIMLLSPGISCTLTLCQSTAIYPRFLICTFSMLTILTMQIENIQRRQISYIFKMKTVCVRPSCYMDAFAIANRIEQESYVKNRFRGKKSSVFMPDVPSLSRPLA